MHRFIIACSVVALLAACGGGGGGDNNAQNVPGSGNPPSAPAQQQTMPTAVFPLRTLWANNYSSNSTFQGSGTYTDRSGSRAVTATIRFLPLASARMPQPFDALPGTYVEKRVTITASVAGSTAPLNADATATLHPSTYALMVLVAGGDTWFYGTRATAGSVAKLDENGWLPPLGARVGDPAWAYTLYRAGSTTAQFTCSFFLRSTVSSGGDTALLESNCVERDGARTIQDVTVVARVTTGGSYTVISETVRNYDPADPATLTVEWK